MTGTCWRRSWRHAASAALLAITLQPDFPQTVAECTIEGDPQRRVYRLVDIGGRRTPRWWLTLRSQSLGDRSAELPLPDAQVERGSSRLRLSSASTNGGLAVEIAAGADKSVLNVFVNFELEVNVWRDLSPDVEQMNTDGEVTARCQVPPEAALFP